MRSVASFIVTVRPFMSHTSRTNAIFRTFCSTTATTALFPSLPRRQSSNPALSPQSSTRPSSLPSTPIVRMSPRTNSNPPLQPPTSRTPRTRTPISTLQVGPYLLEGVSVAADETCIYIPSLSLCFDSGRAPPGSIPMRFMALTHGHCDHMHGVPLHAATRSLQKQPPATYFTPPQIATKVHDLIAAVAALESTALQANVVPLSPEDDDGVPLKKGWILRSFPTVHTVPSQGYVVYQRRRKLLSRYAMLSGEALRKLRGEGVVLTRDVLVPEVAFTGDTTLEALRRCEDARRARVLITEMTFLSGEDVGEDGRGGLLDAEQARAFGHVHFDDVVENVHLFEENEFVVFTHFSARYSHDCIRRAIDRLPMPLREKAFAFGVEGREGSGCNVSKVCRDDHGDAVDCSGR